MAMAYMLLALAAAGCRRPPHLVPEAQPHAGVPPRPAGHGSLLLLPDSAIVVEPGSMEERLARYLAARDPAPRTFRFTGTEFEPWASKPTPDTLRTMYALVQILRAYPHATVTLTGYTDNVGTDAQNRALAAARAKRLADLLVRGGVQPVRITTVGAGAVGFVGDNATEAGRALNRRIELTVTHK